MKISTTRVSTAVLAPLVDAITRDLDRVDQTLATQLIVLTSADRKTVPRTRSGFPAAARTFANVLDTRPEIAAVTGYDRREVVEDLDNVALIAPLLPRLKGLLKRLEDSHLLWLAEAQEPTLAAYAVGRVRAERDGTLSALIEPLQKVLANAPAPDEVEEEDDSTE